MVDNFQTITKWSISFHIDSYISTINNCYLDDFFYKEDSDVWRPNGANSSDAYVSLWQVFKIDKVQDHKWTQMGARQQHRNQFK